MTTLSYFRPTPDCPLFMRYSKGHGTCQELLAVWEEALMKIGRRAPRKV